MYLSPAQPRRPAPFPIPLGRVLIVEPDPLLHDAFRLALARAGASHLLFVEDGRRALQVAERRRPDLILTELLLPGQDGFALARQLCEMPNLHAQVIFVTAAATFAFRERAPQTYGALGAIAKPFTMDGLGASVHALLRAVQTPARAS